MIFISRSIVYGVKIDNNSCSMLIMMPYDGIRYRGFLYLTINIYQVMDGERRRVSVGRKGIFLY